MNTDKLCQLIAVLGVTVQETLFACGIPSTYTDHLHAARPRPRPHKYTNVPTHSRSHYFFSNSPVSNSIQLHSSVKELSRYQALSTALLLTSPYKTSFISSGRSWRVFSPCDRARATRLPNLQVQLPGCWPNSFYCFFGFCVFST